MDLEGSFLIFIDIDWIDLDKKAQIPKSTRHLSYSIKIYGNGSTILYNRSFASPVLIFSFYLSRIYSTIERSHKAKTFQCLEYQSDSTSGRLVAAFFRIVPILVLLGISEKIQDDDNQN